MPTKSVPTKSVQPEQASGEQNARGEFDLAGVITAVVLIIVGLVSLWDTTNMTDPDSFVFPRSVAIAMIIFCMVFIGLQFVSPSLGTNDEAGIRGGSMARRMGLVVAMVISSLLMPWLGFLVSGVLVFAAILLLAMYDEWTPRRRWLFSLVGLLIVLGFYAVFAELLQVPLPVGTLFE